MKHITQAGILSLFLMQATAFAQDTSAVAHKWSLNGYVKDLQYIIFNSVNNQWIAANLIHNRLNFRWMPLTFLTVVAEDRTRMFYTPRPGSLPGFTDTYGKDPGLFHLSANLVKGNSFILNTTLDRAYIDYSAGKFQLTLGRQRINWGQTFVWNPNDIFNEYNYFDFDYEEKPGADAVRIQYYVNATSSFDLAVKADSNKKITAAALFRTNHWNYDFQAFTGIINGNDLVVGGGFSGQLAKGGLRGEVSYFRPAKDLSDQAGILVASLGYDYTFKNSLFLQAECLYNGNKTSLDVLNLYSGAVPALSAENPFLSNFSCFASASYPFNPLLTATLAGILNPKSKIAIGVPSIDYSLSQNLDFSAIYQVFISYQKNNASWLNLATFRLRYSF